MPALRPGGLGPNMGQTGVGSWRGCRPPRSFLGRQCLSAGGGVVSVRDQVSSSASSACCLCSALVSSSVKCCIKIQDFSVSSDP